MRQLSGLRAGVRAGIEDVREEAMLGVQESDLEARLSGWAAVAEYPVTSERLSSASRHHLEGDRVTRLDGDHSRGR
jgi:hypothetical protein